MSAAIHNNTVKQKPESLPAKRLVNPARSNPARLSAWEKILPIQASLKVNTPGDRYEQEADHIANLVMQTPHPQVQRKTCACGKPAGPDGLCDDCRRKKLGIQRMAAGASAGGQTTAPHVIQQKSMAQNWLAPRAVQRQKGKEHDDQMKWLEEMSKRLEPDADSRKMTSDELDFVMAAEKERTKILLSAIEKLNQFTALLITNARELRPMSAETARTLQLVRSYLRIRPKGLTMSGSNLWLEFDYLNKGADETEGSTESNYFFLHYTMKALELMLGNVQLLLPKFVFTKECEPGLYAETLTEIKLCPLFFGKGATKATVCPEWVLVHEYFHPLGVAHGEEFGTTTMSVPGPRQAIRNANALASLAFELAGRDPKACNAYGPREAHGIADCKYLFESSRDPEKYRQCLKAELSDRQSAPSPSKKE